MGEKKGTVFMAAGAIFGICMMILLCVLNFFFSVYITPVLAKAAAGHVWDPDVMRLIMYGLNLGYVLVALAAVHGFYKVGRSLAKGLLDKATEHGVWTLGLALASVLLLGIHMFICLGYIVIWIPL